MIQIEGEKEWRRWIGIRVTSFDIKKECFYPMRRVNQGVIL